MHPLDSISKQRLQPGDRLGRYEIVRRLATGGMAELYVARARGIEGFEKTVVLKRVLPQFCQSEDYIAMFLDEARLGAALAHPNIAQVYDIGEIEGQFYFTMEYVEGIDLCRMRTLGKRQRAPLPLEHALTVVIAAAEGLHHAHEQTDSHGVGLGIIHRDVSPSNVIVSFDGAVKVVDFGVAKATVRRAKTETGLIKGKVGYMSPEQCRGAPVDRRSDIYGLGVLLYELTTGRRLYWGENDMAVLQQTVDGRFEKPSKRTPGYAPELEAIVLKALEKEPERRYRTARALGQDLEQFARANGLLLSSRALGEHAWSLHSETWEPTRAVQVEKTRAPTGGTPMIQPRGTPPTHADEVDTGAASVAWLPPEPRKRANVTKPATLHAARKQATGHADLSGAVDKHPLETLFVSAGLDDAPTCTDEPPAPPKVIASRDIRARTPKPKPAAKVRARPARPAKVHSRPRTDAQPRPVGAARPWAEGPVRPPQRMPVRPIPGRPPRSLRGGQTRFHRVMAAILGTTLALGSGVGVGLAIAERLAALSPAPRTSEAKKPDAVHAKRAKRSRRHRH